MTLPDFLEVFGQVRPGTIIRINGYRSSDGSVKNHALEVLEPGAGYRALVKRSQEMLQERAGTFEDPTDKKACAKLLASYEKTLSAPSAGRGEALDPVRGTVLFRPPNDISKFVLLGARTVFHPLVIREPDTPKRASGRARDPVVVAAENITKTLPLQHFIGRMNLVPGDLESVEIVKP